MAENLGVPMLGIGDEVPNFMGEATTGKVDVHDWVSSGQTFKEGEEVFSVVLTFPALENPVVLSELAWLGAPETQAELASRKLRVLGVCSATMFELKHFLSECSKLVEVDGWRLDHVPMLADEDGEFQRALGCVRPGATDAVRGRVPSSLTLLVSPRREIVFRSEYPVTTGRNFVEMLRVVDSIRVTYVHPRLGTWANWQPGGAEGMLVMPSLDDGSVMDEDEVRRQFPKGMFECLFPWFRITPVPDMPGEGADEDEGADGTA